MTFFQSLEGDQDPVRTGATALTMLPDWEKAIDRVGKQTRNLVNDVLYGIFSNKDEAIEILLAGDVNVPPDLQGPTATDSNTAPAKWLYFLKIFMPFLRERLAQRLVVNTMAGFAGLGLSPDRREHSQGDPRPLHSGGLGTGRQAAERPTSRAAKTRAHRLSARAKGSARLGCRRRRQSLRVFSHRCADGCLHGDVSNKTGDLLRVAFRVTMLPGVRR